VEPVPDDFLTDVGRAQAAARRGDLRLFAYECRSLPWAADGLRAVIRAQRALEAFVDAGETRGWLAAVQPESPDTSDQRPTPSSVTASTSDRPSFGRSLLFTGHMVDAPDRKEPRFPATASAEAEARRQIGEALLEERAQESGRMIGIAGGACGGDILFHEVAEDLGIMTELLLALPPDQFSAESVQHGNADWVARFRRLVERLPTRILADTPELPQWVRSDNYTIWQRNNLWTLFNTLSLDAPRMTLIALWDAGPADGPGGTEDLVEQVKTRGYKVVRLPAERLKALA
jgi:hypothetical protein